MKIEWNHIMYGMGSILDLQPIPRVNVLRYRQHGTCAILRHDWLAVRDDFRTAVVRVMHEVGADPWEIGLGGVNERR